MDKLKVMAESSEVIRRCLETIVQKFMDKGGKAPTTRSLCYAWAVGPVKHL